MFIHLVSLSDDLRHKRIPQEFRIQKAPTFGLDNPKFCEKWCEITNKCSFDLMVLIIQERTDQLTAVHSQIQETREKLSKDYTNKLDERIYSLNVSNTMKN